MECYCIHCKGKKKLVVTKTTYNNIAGEKKVEGKCQKCGEYMCRILYTK